MISVYAIFFCPHYIYSNETMQKIPCAQKNNNYMRENLINVPDLQTAQLF